MTTIEKQNKLRDNIIASFPLILEKLIAFKKEKKSVLVMMKDHKIVKLKPEEFEQLN
jgi:hypothetical protein